MDKPKAVEEKYQDADQEKVAIDKGYVEQLLFQVGCLGEEARTYFDMCFEDQLVHETQLACFQQKYPLIIYSRCTFEGQCSHNKLSGSQLYTFDPTTCMNEKMLLM